MPSVVPSTLKVVCNFCKARLSYGSLPGHYQRFGHGPFSGIEGQDWLREETNTHEYEIKKIKELDLINQKVIIILMAEFWTSIF